jgi:hypothetical protein
MKSYYISRGVLSILFSGAVYLISGSVWVGALSAVLVFATFVLLSRSGRYVVRPDEGATALRRDERTENINQRSGLNAWVVVAVAGSGLVLYYSLISPGDVPVGLLGSLLLLGLATYYVSDFWLRRS